MSDFEQLSSSLRPCIDLSVVYACLGLWLVCYLRHRLQKNVALVIMIGTLTLPPLESALLSLSGQSKFTNWACIPKSFCALFFFFSLHRSFVLTMFFVVQPLSAISLAGILWVVRTACLTVQVQGANDTQCFEFGIFYANKLWG